MGSFGNQQSFVGAASAPRKYSITNTLVWISVTLGVASAVPGLVPGLVLGAYGIPIGLAAAGVSAAALIRLTNKPPEHRRGEMLTMLSLGLGVFQVVFALVGLYFLNAG